MTGIRINGELYTLDALQKSPMGDLFALKAFTQAKGYGVSLKSINAMFDDIATKATDPTFESFDLLDDQSFLANMVGLVYLVRRSNGDKVTLDEAWDTPFNAVDLSGGEDSEAEPAPKDEAALSAESVS